LGSSCCTPICAGGFTAGFASLLSIPALRRSGIDVLRNQICDQGVDETYIGKEILTGPFNISPPRTFAGSSPCMDLGLELPLAAGLGAGEPDAEGAEDV
jgi:hypothetical protein